MAMDYIPAILIGAATGAIVARSLSRGARNGPAAGLRITTPTNPAVVGATSPEPWERLTLLLQSGALTRSEYSLLRSVDPGPAVDTVASLSILRGGPNKIKDIKVLRESFKLDLRDAKAIVDNLPQTFISPMPYAEAVRIAQQLRSTGMTTNIM